MNIQTVLPFLEGTPGLLLLWILCGSLLLGIHRHYLPEHPPSPP